MAEPAQEAQGEEREGLRVERAQRQAQGIPEKRRMTFEEVVNGRAPSPILQLA